MALIYRPKGPALEYADLALNLYKGCAHNCEYCYAPVFTYMTKAPEYQKEQFKRVTIKGKQEISDEKKAKNIINSLRSEVARINVQRGKMGGCTDYDHRILLSFTSDPYQPAEEEFRLTRKALQILGEGNLLATILTKAPNRALQDLELFKKYNTVFAQTICWRNDAGRKKWEPYAGTILDRLTALKVARKAGLQTWVSIEPIIEEQEALDLIDILIGETDLLKIGPVDDRWLPEVYKNINWRDLLEKILQKIHGKQAYYIKNKFWLHADDEIKAKYPKTTEKELERKAEVKVVGC
jgi:DNA repair photolyase